MYTHGGFYVTDRDTTARITYAESFGLVANLRLQLIQRIRDIRCGVKAT